MLSAKKSDMQRPLSLQEALDFFDEEGGPPTNVQALYIEPPQIEEDLSGEDDSDEDGGISDNVCRAQLKAGCEIILENGRRIQSFENEPTSAGAGFDNLDDDLPSSSKRICRVIPSKRNITIPPASTSSKDMIFTWRKAQSIAMVPVFPETNYEDCRHLRPHELFEKFFDNDLLEHIIKCSNLYAIHRQKRCEELTIEELRVFIGILIVSGYKSTVSFRSMWSSDDDLRNIMVYNAMRRNRFEEINSMLHFEPSLCKPKESCERNDTLWKLRPLTDHIKAKMLENFHPEQNLSYDDMLISDAMVASSL